MTKPRSDSLGELFDRFRYGYQGLGAAIGEYEQAAASHRPVQPQAEKIKDAIIAIEHELKCLREAVGFDLADDMAVAETTANKAC